MHTAQKEETGMYFYDSFKYERLNLQFKISQIEKDFQDNINF